MVSQFDGVGVVIDVGSQFTKAGFAGEATPRCFIPSTVGRYVIANLLISQIHKSVLGGMVSFIEQVRTLEAQLG